MKRLAQAVVITRLADQLREKGSWCGETHLQKSVYLLQELEMVPLGFEFILYKHGPFSFDLRDRLTELRADGFVELMLRPYPYGPTFAPSEQIKKIWNGFPNTLGKYKTQLDRVSKLVGNSGVAELEKIATALYVTKEMGNDTPSTKRAKRMIELKPHVEEDDAIDAIKSIDKAIKVRKH